MTVALAVLTGAAGRARAVPNAAGTLPPARPATGRIEGTVEISSTLAARRAPIRIYADPGSGSTPPASPRDPIAAELKNVVVYLDGDGEHLPASPSRIESHRHGSIAQRDERFAPHVVAVMQGGKVEFPNEDDVFHNVYSLSSGSTFDLGRYPKGSSRAATFNRVATVTVFCHIHQDMSAVVLVLSNPFFASPGDDHKFVIDDVPEGDYTVVGWHERIKTPITWRVHVTAGQATVVDFNIPLPQGGRVPR
ncbi:MAG: hypothetical protein ABJF01_19315 [bacterium]